MSITIEEKSNGRKPYSNLQQTYPKQNPTNNKTNGKTLTTRILPEEEYIKEIYNKTEEELTEYLEATTKEHKLEELSDLLELINALAEHEGTTLEEINNIRKRKQKKKAVSQIESF